MPLIVGLDTEYSRGVGEFSMPEGNDSRNRVLSYQLWFLDTNTSREGGIVIPVENGHKLSGRLTLASLLGMGFVFAKQAGIVEQLPGKIILAAHFWRADLPSLKDFKKLKRRVDAVRNTYVSAKQPFVQDIFVHGRRHRLSITMVDTMLLAPAGHQSLAALGDLLGIEKVELPDGMIERMDILQKENPELFEKYALRDAKIAAKWVREILAFFTFELGLNLNRYPVTLGAAGVKMFLGGLDGGQLGTLLGISDTVTYHNGNRCWRDNIGDLISFFANCYHGGRNEAFAVGYHEGHLTDIDLVGAYTTAMAAIRYPNWDGLVETTDMGILAQPDALCVARVSFRFPPSTRVPSLPVRAGNRGLIYPLEGVSYCTGAELLVARNLGAEIEVMKGVYVPWLDNERPYAEFTKTINSLRKKYPKGSVLERVAKEIGNSLYGKTAQGVANMRGNRDGAAQSVRQTRSFDSREGKMRDLDPSKITQPLLAAFITGLVRAVLSEMIAALPSDAKLLTATTDGFLSDVDADRLNTSGPLIRFFSQLREIVSGDPNPIEVKGEAAEVIVVKTRGAFATKPIDAGNPGKPILARAGQKLETPISDRWEECREWEQIYRARTYDLKHTQRRMIDLQTQWQSDADLTDYMQEVRVNLDYDLKRKPVAVANRNGVICCSTEPWQTVGEFNTWRDAFEKWRAKKGRVLRTVQDWEDFVAYKRDVAQKAQAGVRTSRRPPVVQLFLRCYAFGKLGLPGRDFAAAAGLVTEHGWPTTIQNVKDAKRRGSVKVGVIDELDEAERNFLLEAAERWPEFDYTALLTTGDPPTLMAGQCQKAES